MPGHKRRPSMPRGLKAQRQINGPSFHFISNGYQPGKSGNPASSSEAVGNDGLEIKALDFKS